MFKLVNMLSLGLDSPSTIFKPDHMEQVYEFHSYNRNRMCTYNIYTRCVFSSINLIYKCNIRNSALNTSTCIYLFLYSFYIKLGGIVEINLDWRNSE
jgi:hypothetical protein